MAAAARREMRRVERVRDGGRLLRLRLLEVDRDRLLRAEQARAHAQKHVELLGRGLVGIDLVAGQKEHVRPPPLIGHDAAQKIVQRREGIPAGLVAPAAGALHDLQVRDGGRDHRETGKPSLLITEREPARLGGAIRKKTELLQPRDVARRRGAVGQEAQILQPRRVAVVGLDDEVVGVDLSQVEPGRGGGLPDGHDDVEPFGLRRSCPCRARRRDSFVRPAVRAIPRLPGRGRLRSRRSPAS